MKNDLLSKVKKEETKEKKEDKKALTIYEYVEKSADQVAIALPKQFKGNEEKFIRVCKTEIRKSYKLLEACKSNPQGLMGAFMTSCEIGLLIGGVLNECHLVPFWNKNMQRFDIQLIISYQGLMKLAKRGGAKKIEVFPVHENEVKEKMIEIKYGVNENFDFTPMLFGDKGKKIGYVAYAVLENGEKRFEFYTMEFINKRKEYAVSKSYEKYHEGWEKWEDAFERKTVVRNFCKIIGLSMEEISKDDKVYDYNETEGIKEVEKEVGKPIKSNEEKEKVIEAETIEEEKPVEENPIEEKPVEEKLTKDERIKNMLKVNPDLLSFARTFLRKHRLKNMGNLSDLDIARLEGEVFAR